jgi:hypothetical protein
MGRELAKLVSSVVSALKVGDSEAASEARSKTKRLIAASFAASLANAQTH